VFHRENDVLRAGTGIAVPGATITVYVNGTDNKGDYSAATKAPIFATNDEATDSLANSTVVADANGHYEYFVADGVYDEVLKYGQITAVDDYIQMYDAAGAQALVVAEAVVARDAARAAANDAQTSANASETSRSNAAVSEVNSAASAATAAANAAAAVGTPALANRAALAAVVGAAGIARQLTEAGREGLFIFSSANHGSDVTNDPQQGIYVAPASDATGASGAWVRQFSAAPSVKWFGAKGDANDTGSTGTDDTNAIQAALNYAGIAGGRLYFPEGKYKTTAYLTISPHTHIVGSGRATTWIVGTHAGAGGANAGEDLRNGSIFYSAKAVNTSNTTDVVIEHLAMVSGNGGNVGAGYYDLAGGEIRIANCKVYGTKYGIVFDQTECALVDFCELSPLVAGGAGVWIVNGDDLSAGASGGFTNSISIRDCTLNVPAGLYGIVDDGGLGHRISGGVFNGGINAIRAAGGIGLVIDGIYSESHSGASIVLSQNTLAGDGVGICTATIINPYIASTAGNGAIRSPDNGGILSVIGGVYNGGGGTVPLVGAANFLTLDIITPNNSTGTANFCDGMASLHHLESYQVRGHASGIGYEAGAGGTAVQATSKATGVALSKACGQITMNGAALAANTAVSFTLTNALIAAGDKLVLNHDAAGTLGAYALNARCAAGSATISVRNLTVGSLAEAIVVGFALVKAKTA
jgi:hypothetical protein